MKPGERNSGITQAYSFHIVILTILYFNTRTDWKLEKETGTTNLFIPLIIELNDDTMYSTE